MIYILSLVFGVIVLVSVYVMSRKKRYDYLSEMDAIHISRSNETEQMNAVNMAFLLEETLWSKMKRWVKTTQQRLKPFALIKVLVYVALVAVILLVVNRMLFNFNIFITLAVGEIIAIIFALEWLQKSDRKKFDTVFPNALNMLVSVISSGSTVVSALNYVGEELKDTELGKEFKLMGERLLLGEPTDSVFQKACERYHYLPFKFFVVTLNASMQRGGQLKMVMKRLNRLLANARTLEKKKDALTTEVRFSAKIVCAIPFLFLFGLSFVSPDNFNYILHDSNGNILLYYLLSSEALGMLIIYWLMKGVRIS